MATLQSAIARVPTPLRVTLAVWVLISVGFNISSPASTANLSPAVGFIVLLPAALVSIGVAIYTLWHGGLTLLRTAKSAIGGAQKIEDVGPTAGTSIGGIGALNIYMIALFGSIFGISQVFGSYTVSIVMSIGVFAGMILVLAMRKKLPLDVKIFLWSAASVTFVFAVIMMTLDAPPTPTI